MWLVWYENCCESPIAFSSSVCTCMKVLFTNPLTVDTYRIYTVKHLGPNCEVKNSDLGSDCLSLSPDHHSFISVSVRAVFLLLPSCSTLIVTKCHFLCTVIISYNAVCIWPKEESKGLTVWQKGGGYICACSLSRKPPLLHHLQIGWESCIFPKVLYWLHLRHSTFHRRIWLCVPWLWRAVFTLFH